MPTIHTREELCNVIMGASTREEMEAADKAFDEWLQVHPEDNSIESPV
jgi:hypothetical protein